MEYEVRFYYSLNEKENIINDLDNIIELKNKGTFYEKTSQYNTNDVNNDFYSKEIDGRFRIRITKNDNISKCMLSWKRRLNDSINSKVNMEEEIETRINPDDYNNFVKIVEDVLKMNRVESYERYRTIYSNNEIEIDVDEYPFALALEIEAKVNNNQEDIIDKYVNLLKLDYNNSYRLSWDDKYEELCESQNIKKLKDVLFSIEEMPKL